MDIINAAFFYILAFSCLISALGVVLSKKIVYSAISLVITFLSIAGIFLLLNADFVGIAQIIIYAVGVAILLIFAIMLTSPQIDEKLWIAKAPRTLLSLMFSFLIFLSVSFAVTNGFKGISEDVKIFNVKQPDMQTVETIKKEGTTGIVGQGLFTNYVLPFEVLSILLLAAILGSVVIARKNGDKLVNPTTISESKRG